MCFVAAVTYLTFTDHLFEKFANGAAIQAIWKYTRPLGHL